MMKQLTPLDQGALNAWYAQAFRNPRVRAFLTHAQFASMPTIGADDWAETFFLDAGGEVMMRLTFDRQSHAASVGLWSLEVNPQSVAGAMRDLFRVHAPRYGLQWYTFCVHDGNVEWLAALRERFRFDEWGVEPEGAWDGKEGRWVPAHRFKVNIAAYLLSQRRRYDDKDDIPF